MGKEPPSFLSVLLVLGLLFLFAIGLDLLWRGTHRYPASPEWAIEGADARRGRMTIERYGCGACHVIPGVRQARGRVGPKLEDFSRQIFIAGKLGNTPENLIVWLRDPDAVNPGTAMPNMGVTEEEARDIAAYLYTLN